MEFVLLPSNSRTLLFEIVSADDPAALLCEKYDNASARERDELRGILRELTENGFLRILWADNKPYYVTINNSARTYEEQLAEYKHSQKREQTGSVVIGNNNSINNSVIAESVNIREGKQNQNFYEKHPVICGFLISLVVGIVLLFSFWHKVIDCIEGLF